MQVSPPPSAARIFTENETSAEPSQICLGSRRGPTEKVGNRDKIRAIRFRIKPPATCRSQLARQRCPLVGCSLGIGGAVPPEVCTLRRNMTLEPKWLRPRTSRLKFPKGSAVVAEPLRTIKCHSYTRSPRSAALRNDDIRRFSGF